MSIIADVQSRTDTRDIVIQQVGIKDLQVPIELVDKSAQGETTAFHALGSVNASVTLPAAQKGTHMSRFVTCFSDEIVSIGLHTLPAVVDKIATLMETDAIQLSVSSHWCRQKSAPVSGANGWLSYPVTFEATLANHKLTTIVTLQVPVTSLCPCSKTISNYGAHNQRSHINCRFELKNPMPLNAIIELIEAQASCELWSVLKRADEKYVTEKAYDNPKFVEDIIRDIAQTFNACEDIVGYEVSVENFESIHNHSAYAWLRGKAPLPPRLHQCG